MKNASMKNTRLGFTLLELLVVMAILIVIIALIFPIIKQQWDQAKVAQAQLQISNFQKYLDMYQTDHGTYPTTQQGGLLVLVGQGYQVQPMMSGTPGSEFGVGPGQQGGMDMMSGGMDPMSGGMGAGMGGNPGMMPGQQQGFGGDMNPGGGMMTPTTGVGTGSMEMNNMNTMPGGMQGGMQTGMEMGGMGSNPGMMPGSQPGFDQGTMGADGLVGNQQGQFSSRQGSNAGKNYIGVASLPVDPWGNEYHYEYPTARTLSGKPALWSDGPNGIGDDEDDIVSWKSELDEANKDPNARAMYEKKKQERQMQLQQQQQRQQQGGMQPNMGGPQGMLPGPSGMGMDGQMGGQMTPNMGVNAAPSMPGQGNMPNMGGQGGMPNMPGQGGMPNMPGQGGMPSMPGQGGMPNMPGQGGMPNMQQGPGGPGM
ncbi:MAG: type II secretion system protein GspG [Thermoguttaceae bacterium]